MIRKLGIFEKAMLIANKHAPFNIVSVLRMGNAPQPETVKMALVKLQKRHPFLRAGIVNEALEFLPSLSLPFTTKDRMNENQWRDIVEGEMAFTYGPAKPLLNAVYLYKDGYGELILNVHHVIMDAASGMNLLDELLQLCAGSDAPLPPLDPAPAMETRFPPSYQGLRRIVNVAGYALAQMVDMARFMWRTRKERTPPVHLGGNGHIATLILPEDLVDSLARQGRKDGITLNSLLNAALVLAVNRHLYKGQPVTTRTFSFADLRPYTQPPTPPEYLANYISMMGYTLDVAEDVDFWELARDLHGKIYRSLKHGDKFSASLMSEALLRMFTKMKSMRFGATALNYSSFVPLKTRYGKVKLVGLHGFVSGYDLGPELASQARLFDNQLWWDFIYLDTDMDAEMAGNIIDEIKAILEEAGRGSD